MRPYRFILLCFFPLLADSLCLLPLFFSAFFCFLGTFLELVAHSVSAQDHLDEGQDNRHELRCARNADPCRVQCTATCSAYLGVLRRREWVGEYELVVHSRKLSAQCRECNPYATQVGAGCLCLLYCVLDSLLLLFATRLGLIVQEQTEKPEET